MNSFVKMFLSHKPSSFFFIGFGVLLVLLSFFFPFVKYFQGNEAQVIVVSELISKILHKEFLQVFFLPFLMFPYVFIFLALILLLLGKKENLLRYVRLPIKIFAIISLLVNFYVYFGYYAAPRKGILVSIFGFILVAIMLFSFYYYSRLSRIQTKSASKVFYLVMALSVFSVTNGFMVFVTMVTKNFHLQVGSYGFLFGLIFLLIGLLIYNNYLLLNKSEWLIPITEDKLKKPKIVTRIKEKYEQKKESRQETQKESQSDQSGSA